VWISVLIVKMMFISFEIEVLMVKAQNMTAYSWRDGQVNDSSIQVKTEISSHQVFFYS
jgi:hypothetical protein